MDEAAELTRAQAGDKDAQGQVLERHRGLMVQWCNQMVMAGFDLDDMIQECCIAGLDAIKYYKADTGFAFTTYLKRCCRNRLAKWRDDKRQRPLPQEGEEDGRDGLDKLPAHEAVDMDWLREAMEKLTPLEREVLTLKYGLSGGGTLDAGAVANRLGVGVDAVKWAEWRAGESIKSRVRVADRPHG